MTQPFRASLEAQHREIERELIAHYPFVTLGYKEMQIWWAEHNAIKARIDRIAPLLNHVPPHSDGELALLWLDHDPSDAAGEAL